MPELFFVNGGQELHGEVLIGGAKNAVLPIMAASIVASERVVLRNVPSISDIFVMATIMRDLGVSVTYQDGTLIIDSPKQINTMVSEEASKIRFSILLLGAVLVKMGEVHTPLPGGDALGQRRIDQHVLALKNLGAEVHIDQHFIHATARNLNACSYQMTFPSVSGTENSVLMACAAHGVSEISGLALEPEVQSFMHFLVAIGAKIQGIGTDCVRIVGCPQWRGADFTILPDRLEAMTYAMYVGAAGGEVKITNFDPSTLGAEWDVLQAIGLHLERISSGILVFRDRTIHLKPQRVSIGRFPQFHTDLQPIVVALLGLSDGNSIVTETLYGNERFQYIAHFQKMGAQMSVQNDTVEIQGISYYNAARVKATDIRAGAALVLAALTSEEATIIEDIHHIDRGYENFEAKLTMIGGNIRRQAMDN